MTLRFYARFHPSGLRSVALCRINQPDVWQDLCKGFSIKPCVVSGCVSLSLKQLSYRKAIRQYCDDCAELWETELKKVVEPKLKKLFDCQIKDTIRCFVGLYPTYLRSIKAHYFLLPYGVSQRRLREIIIHELSHFYCYAACGNGLTSDKLWKLSETIVPFILNYSFKINCNAASYAGEASSSEKSLICSWVNGNISFEKLIASLNNHE